MFYIYGMAECRFCDLAREYLEDHGKDYSYFDVTVYPSLTELFQNEGWKTVPQIFEDEYHIGGFTDLIMHMKKEEV